MNEITRRIVKRLREAPGSLSRNRNFQTFEDPAVRRALHIVRFLKGLERDLLRNRDAEGIQLRRVGAHHRVRIKLSFPNLRGTRTSYLSEAEFELLLINPEVRALLAAEPSA